MGAYRVKRMQTESSQATVSYVWEKFIKAIFNSSVFFQFVPSCLCANYTLLSRLHFATFLSFPKESSPKWQCFVGGGAYEVPLSSCSLRARLLSHNNVLFCWILASIELVWSEAKKLECVGPPVSQQRSSLLTQRVCCTLGLWPRREIHFT